ncbi:MAG: nucleotidyltransferase domain-containing protein [Candidatus Pacearchaeota archaeon]|nr:nucleotidyltransferase domain-containing protein [Candidatus Pacearchaeota archaeon]
MELIKNTIRVGNSAGVLLPKEWLNTQVRVVLQPLNIEREVLEILIEEKLLKNLMGVYIVGSYARNEQTIDSDIDILVITDSIDKRIKKGKYEIIFISKENVEKQLKNNILPLLPMIKEAKTLLNPTFLESYKEARLTIKNLKWHIDTTKSAMRVVDASIKLAEESNIKIGDGYAYSLILRLRTTYIIDCLKKGGLWTKKEFLDLIKKISGSLTAYERYISSKNKDTLECKLPIEEAKRLMGYVNKKNKEAEKWLKEKKDQERKE